MIWIDVSHKNAEIMATYGLIEGEYPAIGGEGIYCSPVSKNRANTTLPLIREDGILKIGVREDDFYLIFDSEKDVRGMELTSYHDFTGKDEDMGVAYIAII